MQYNARISWKRSTATPFNAKSFDRTHKIYFGSGLSIEACSAPEFLGRSDLPNPEEMFIAAISSCFMLTFLYWAAADGLVIEQYQDEAVGTLAKGPEGKMMITEVTLTPAVNFQANKNPEPEVLTALLKKAHDNCFISCSVRTKVLVKCEQLAHA
jgi:organic hydroperoxide reductase OsmC/OhrA